MLDPVEMVRQGATYSEAAKACGISRSSVAGKCYRAGVKAPLDDRKRAIRDGVVKRCSADPIWAAAHSAQAREALRKARADPRYEERRIAAFRAAISRRRGDLARDPVILAMIRREEAAKASA